MEHIHHYQVQPPGRYYATPTQPTPQTVPAEWGHINYSLRHIRLGITNRPVSVSPPVLIITQRRRITTTQSTIQVGLRHHTRPFNNSRLRIRVLQRTINLLIKTIGPHITRVGAHLHQLTNSSNLRPHDTRQLSRLHRHLPFFHQLRTLTSARTSRASTSTSRGSRRRRLSRNRTTQTLRNRRNRSRLPESTL